MLDDSAPVKLGLICFSHPNFEMSPSPMSTGVRKTYQAFISYSQTDHGLVRDLRCVLERSGIAYWLDEDKLVAGERFDESIKQAIKGSSSLLLCASESSLQSPYVLAEVEYARINGIRIIPILVDDIQPEDFNICLSGVMGVDIRKNPFSSERRVIEAISRAAINSSYEPHELRIIKFPSSRSRVKLSQNSKDSDINIDKISSFTAYGVVRERVA